MKRLCFVLSCLLMIMNRAQAEQPARPFLVQHCEKCHSGDKPQGEFSMATLTDDFNDKQNRQRWLSVLEQLRADSMPPKERPRPPAHDRQVVMKWIEAQSSKSRVGTQGNRRPRRDATAQSRRICQYDT